MANNAAAITPGHKRRGSKVYVADLAVVDEAVLAELTMTPAPWTHAQLFLSKGDPPAARFIVAHMAKYRRFIPDPRWWDVHGIDLALGGEGKSQLMVAQYGMRKPFPVDTVYRWFEEIVSGLRARAVDMVAQSPWRRWAAEDLLVMLREHAWSSEARQLQLQAGAML